VEELMAQRVCGVALDYQDLHDHDELLGILKEKKDP
jgi:hypothetical protein